jgi:glutamate/aspartate transport system substrate-binding protein
MKTNALFTLVLSSVLSLCLLASPRSEAHPWRIQKTLDRIAATKTITLGFQDDAFPFSYLNGQQPAGYSVEICNKLVEGIRNKLQIKDLKVRWLQSSTASQFVLIKSHMTDVMCIPAFYSDVRHRQAEFSPPIFFSRTRFLTLKNHDTDYVGDLAGHSVLVKSGTIYVDQLHKINRSNALNLNIELDTSNAAAFQEVADGDFPALVSSSVLLKGMIALSDNPAQFEISKEALSLPIPAGLLLPLDDSEFKAFVDNEMMSFVTSKAFLTLYQKWFQSPIPPKAINLNIPMSPDLKALTTATSNYVY